MKNTELKKYLAKAKTQLWTIPNILTYIRILLIPVFIILYINNYLWASIGILIFSGITDTLDGYIARKCNQVTELGIFIDSAADKLVQIATIICVSIKFPYMWIMFIIHMIRELIMLYMGYYVLEETGEVHCAKWYGKLCTFMLYAIVIIHLVWVQIPLLLSNILILICSLMIVFCLIMYLLNYEKCLKEAKNK